MGIIQIEMNFVIFAVVSALTDPETGNAHFADPVFSKIRNVSISTQKTLSGFRLIKIGTQIKLTKNEKWGTKSSTNHSYYFGWPWGTVEVIKSNKLTQQNGKWVDSGITKCIRIYRNLAGVRRT